MLHKSGFLIVGACLVVMLGCNSDQPLDTPMGTEEWEKKLKEMLNAK